MSRSCLAYCLLLLLFPRIGNAQAKTDEGRRRTSPADKAELAAITERGRALAAYDAAAWCGSDAVQPLNPPDENIGMYLGRKSDQGWIVGFGLLNDAKDAFLVGFETVPTQDVKHPSVITHQPMIEDRGVWFHEALAFDKFRSELTSHGRPYNLAVTPAPDGNWSVYSYPAQTDLDIFPYGGDTRFTVSSDGTSLLATHKMYMSILENKAPKGVSVKMTYRTAFLDDAPEDTDVSSVIMMDIFRCSLWVRPSCIGLKRMEPRTTSQQPRLFSRTLEKRTNFRSVKINRVLVVRPIVYYSFGEQT